MTERILIVDDEANHRLTLRIHLRAEGFDVEEAVDGIEALERIVEGEFDIVLVDLMMPGMSGLELTRQIRLRSPSQRVVLTSAYHLSRDQLERAGVGAVGFIPKPYDADELVGFLRSKLRSPATVSA